MVDHVSDTFVDPFVPLNRMVEAAFRGDILIVEECSAQFTAHAEKLAHVSDTDLVTCIVCLIYTFTVHHDVLIIACR